MPDRKAVISRYLKNIFESGELFEESVAFRWKQLWQTAADGKRYNTNDFLYFGMP